MKKEFNYGTNPFNRMAGEKKEKEFNLSEKIIDEGYYIPIKDVKEAVKKLKEEIEKEEFTYTDDLDRLFPIIDKIFGKKLI